MDKISHVKEKSDMILEPLQVMIQLALLAYCPIGTKLSISENILHLQLPSWSQGVTRWYMKDNKDDLYYLFQAIRRYYLWYKPDSNVIYEKILETAIKGIRKLIKTYENTDKISIRHTLTLYTNILSLESPELFKETTEDAISLDSVFENITKLYNNKILSIVYNSLLILDTSSENDIQHISTGLQEILKPQHLKIKTWIRENLTC
tara:strand:+ start:551 stop:1168 length:618 start_codon:yes stop_codon:yes gene_type:complete